MKNNSIEEIRNNMPDENDIGANPENLRDALFNTIRALRLLTDHVEKIDRCLTKHLDEQPL